MRRFVIIAGLLLCSLPVWSSLSVLQAFNAATGGTGTTEVTANVTTTAGSLLVGFCGENTNNSTAFTITDPVNGTWTQAGGYVGIATSRRAAVFYKPNAGALSSQAVTCDYQSVSVAGRKLVVYEIAGAATSSPLDANAANPASGSNSSSVTSQTSGALSTNTANDILMYAVYAPNASTSMTVGSGYTFTTGSNNTGIGVQQQIVSATQSSVTTSMSWTTSSTDIWFFLAFTQAATGVINHRAISQ